MSKQFNTYRVGIESMTETQLGWWEKKGVTYKPILEYNPLSKEETSRLKTEYYDNNNRVGFEKLYAAVRKPAGKYLLRRCGSVNGTMPVSSECGSVHTEREYSWVCISVLSSCKN